MKTIPVSEARAHLNALIDDLTADDEEIALTKHGRPVAYVRSADAATRDEDTMFWLSQPGLGEDITSAQTGGDRNYSLDEVRAHVAKRAEREGVTL